MHRKPKMICIEFFHPLADDWMKWDYVQLKALYYFLRLTQMGETSCRQLARSVLYSYLKPIYLTEVFRSTNPVLFLATPIFDVDLGDGSNSNMCNYCNSLISSLSKSNSSRIEEHENFDIRNIPSLEFKQHKGRKWSPEASETVYCELANPMTDEMRHHTVRKSMFSDATLI